MLTPVTISSSTLNPAWARPTMTPAPNAPSGPPPEKARIVGCRASGRCARSIICSASNDSPRATIDGAWAKIASRDGPHDTVTRNKLARAMKRNKRHGFRQSGSVCPTRKGCSSASGSVGPYPGQAPPQPSRTIARMRIISCPFARAPNQRNQRCPRALLPVSFSMATTRPSDRPT